MSTTTKIRIGLTMARELELEVEDAEMVATELEGAIRDGRAFLWITDDRGHRHGIVVENLAFVEIEHPQARTGVGFGISADVTGG